MKTVEHWPLPETKLPLDVEIGLQVDPEVNDALDVTQPKISSTINNTLMKRPGWTIAGLTAGIGFFTGFLAMYLLARGPNSRTSGK